MTKVKIIEVINKSVGGAGLDPLHFVSGTASLTRMDMVSRQLTVAYVYHFHQPPKWKLVQANAVPCTLKYTDRFV